MVESKFITELPEHKSDTNYFGLDSAAERALVGFCDKFYELLKETELGNTSSVVKLLPCGLEHTALIREEEKKLTNSENRAVLETRIKLCLFFNQNCKSVVLKRWILWIQRVLPSSNATTGSPPPIFTNPQIESNITSLLFPLRVSLLF